MDGVEVVCLRTLQGTLEGAHGVVAVAVRKLRDEVDVLAASAKSLANTLLTEAGAVIKGRVEVGDAQVERLVDDGGGVVFILIGEEAAPAAKGYDRNSFACLSR